MRDSRAKALSTPFPFRDGKTRADGRVYDIDKWLMRKILQAIGDPLIRVVLWDGKEIINPNVTPSVGMVIHDRVTLWRLLTNPFLNFGDYYCAGRIDIEGDLVTFTEAVYRALAKLHNPWGRCKPSVFRRNHSDKNSLSRSRQNIHYHYDIGNDFYQLWLDKEMLYTCAYFPEPGSTLEEAQIAKMDLVCRKLRLKAGQRVVEAGCGWGALALYMARRYGAKVRAYNISGEQIAYARKRAKAEGMEGQVEYIEDDYRNISGEYDTFVSVGMLEHVGPDHYRELGRVIDKSLTEEGFGLIHSIGQNTAEPMGPWLLKRIFPASYPPTLREMMDIFEPLGFTVLDVENLRLHYARTLEHWLERFEKNTDRVLEMFDDCFIRAWRLYLSGAIANFNLGALQLFQVVFSRPGNNLVPWTRSHLTTPTESSDGNM